jgi:hypothetical protein
VLTWLDSNGLAEAARTNNSGTTYSTINFPGATQSYAQDINTSGDIVYQWFDSGNHSHGGLHRGKKFYQLDVPKAYSTYGGGLNDHNTIVGGFMATPVAPLQGFTATF